MDMNVACKEILIIWVSAFSVMKDQSFFTYQINRMYKQSFKINHLLHVHVQTEISSLNYN